MTANTSTNVNVYLSVGTFIYVARILRNLSAWAPHSKAHMALHQPWYTRHGIEHGLYTPCVHAEPHMSGRQSLLQSNMTMRVP